VSRERKFGEDAKGMWFKMVIRGSGGMVAWRRQRATERRWSCLFMMGACTANDRSKEREKCTLEKIRMRKEWMERREFWKEREGGGA
jgi:hypothetical protein